MTKTSHAYMIGHISLNNKVDMYSAIFRTRYEIHV